MEINFMKTIGLHENVVTMLGCCTLYPPLCLLVEYIPHGDLLHYLRDLRKTVMTYHSKRKLKKVKDFLCKPYSSRPRRRADIRPGKLYADVAKLRARFELPRKTTANQTQQKRGGDPL